MPKPIKITTVELARALPEMADPFFEEHRETDPVTGITTISRSVRPFVPTPTDGDQILLFIDSDGRSMKVEYTLEGPVKTEFRL